MENYTEVREMVKGLSDDDLQGIYKLVKDDISYEGEIVKYLIEMETESRREKTSINNGLASLYMKGIITKEQYQARLRK